MAQIVESKRGKRKIGLDIVRACAISLVLGCHFKKNLDILGIYGVELFFALSGFLIGGILCRLLDAKQKLTFEAVKNFWYRRWWRTLPNYYLFLVFSLLFHFNFGGLPSLGQFAPFLVFTQNMTSVPTVFFGVSWSLCVEEWFYLLFPLSILVFTSLHFSKRSAFFAATLVFLIIPPALRELMFSYSDPAAMRMMTLPRLDAICYGVATSFFLARAKLTVFSKNALAVAAFVGILGLCIYQHSCSQVNALVSFYRVTFIVLPICFSLMLPAFDLIESLPPRWTFLERPITSISLWSYSIYLSHIPILFWTYAAFGSLREFGAINVLAKITGLVLCVSASKILYNCFESRCMLLRPSEGEWTKPLPLSLQP